MINQGFPNKTTSNILYRENRLLHIVFPSGERPTAGNCQDTMGNTRKFEAVFRSGIFRIFQVNSDNFLYFPAGSVRKSSEKFPAGILLPYSSDFRCFPAGFCGRNHRPGKQVRYIFPNQLKEK